MLSRNRGFSLLELMVVIVIMALLFTYTSLNIRTHDPVDLIKQEATRFNLLVGLLQEEAILRGEDFGIEFQRHEYQFVRYNEGKWIAVDNDRTLKRHELPHEIEIDLAVEQTGITIGSSTSTEKDDLNPQVFVLSSGEITPEFDVAFFIPTITTRYIVKGSFDGKHSAKLED